MRTGSLVVIIATVLCCFGSSGTLASGCMREIAVPVTFQQGAVCWWHAGAGTTFKGQFGRNQHVTAVAMGEENTSDAGNRPLTIAAPWQLTLNGPHGFSANSGPDGQLSVVLPENGQYSLVTFPCAIWGNQGMVEICAQ